MTTKKSKNDYGPIAVVIAIILGIILIGVISSSAEKSSRISSCENKGKVYVERTGECREKTVSEKFDEKCVVGDKISGKYFSCSDIRKQNLERAYLNDNIIVHNGVPYEGGTEAEIQAGKMSKDYCLGAGDTWHYYGSKRCVAFRYRYLACSGGVCFLDQYKDYKKGFVVYFGYGMYNWNSFKKKFMNHGTIVVCGTIVKYQNHPEIKVYSKKAFQVDPTPTYRGDKKVYEYTCS